VVAIDLRWDVGIRDCHYWTRRCSPSMMICRNSMLKCIVCYRDTWKAEQKLRKQKSTQMLLRVNFEMTFLKRLKKAINDRDNVLSSSSVICVITFFIACSLT
jgi:hypothetical protein